MRIRALLILATALLGVMALSGAAWAVVATFAATKNYPAGDGSEAVSAGDLDGDGDTDLVTANRYSDNVSVLIRRSDGTFRAQQKYAAGDSPEDVIVREDLDGDRDRDLAAANYGSDDVSVRLGRGDGTFGAQIRYAAGPSGPIAIESGDLDGDGDKDLVTANSGGGHGSKPNYSIFGNVAVFKNRGDGTFRAARNYTAGEAYEPTDVDRSDLDGDGDEDLVVSLDSTRAGDGGVAVLFNDGNGAFGSPKRYGGFCPKGVLAHDLDGDGDPDLAAADFCEDAVTVYENGGDGRFAYQGSYPVGEETPQGDTASTPYALTEFDFDSDGDTDIATANPGSWNGFPDNISVLENAGDGTLGNPRVFGAGVSPIAITRARMDADRKPDLVVANFYSDNVSVLRNTTQ